MSKELSKELPELEKVFRSSHCEFSMIENKLVTLYENQEKIYAAIKMLLDLKGTK